MAQSEIQTKETDAILQLTNQLQEKSVPTTMYEGDDKTIQAIDSMTGIALLSKATETKIAVQDSLGEHLSIQPINNTLGHLVRTQSHAAQMLEAIAQSSGNVDVKGNAVQNLSRGLNVTSSYSTYTHNELILGIASIALGSTNDVKKLACDILGGYSQKKVERFGYVGSSATPEAQKLALQLIGVLTIPPQS